VNKDIMCQLRFNKEVDLIEKGICPFCKKEIKLTEFKNEISEREFKISGLCRECQDKTFKEK